MIDYLPTFEYQRHSPTGKTKIWYVLNHDGSTFLGSIKWYGVWRRYVFHPDIDTIYEQKCLRHIANFCENQSTEARQSWAKTRAKKKQ